jgi:hypothetical protein
MVGLVVFTATPCWGDRDGTEHHRFRTGAAPFTWAKFATASCRLSISHQQGPQGPAKGVISVQGVVAMVRSRVCAGHAAPIRRTEMAA